MGKGIKREFEKRYKYFNKNKPKIEAHINNLEQGTLNQKRSFQQTLEQYNKIVEDLHAELRLEVSKYQRNKYSW
jgi:exonuclease VII small subunit